MMRFSARTAAIVLACAVLVSWCATPVSLRDALETPWRVLRDSGIMLQGRLLDVSENSEPLLNAGRRLLKPFGALRLDRVVRSDDSRRSTRN